jgi:hypothetical protein
VRIIIDSLPLYKLHPHLHDIVRVSLEALKSDSYYADYYFDKNAINMLFYISFKKDKDLHIYFTKEIATWVYNPERFEIAKKKFIGKFKNKILRAMIKEGLKE